MPISIKRVQLLNFLSHQNTDVPFGENEKILIDGDSGAGKSSLIDAVVFALYGEGRSDNKGLVRRGAEGCRVTLELADGNRTWRIIRGVTAKGTSSLDISLDEAGKSVPLQCTSVKEKNDFIENEIVRSSYALFSNSVLFPQEQAESFLKMSAADRKDLLMQIVGAADIDAFGDKVKTAASQAESSKMLAFQRESMAMTVRDTSVSRLSAAKAVLIDPATALERLNSALSSLQTSKDTLDALERDWEPHRTKAAELAYRRVDAQRLRTAAETPLDPIDWFSEATRLDGLLKEHLENRLSLEKLDADHEVVRNLKFGLRPDSGFAEREKQMNARLIAAMNESLDDKKCGKCGEPYEFAKKEKDARVADITRMLEEDSAIEQKRIAYNANIEKKLASMPSLESLEAEAAPLRALVRSGDGLSAALATARANASKSNDQASVVARAKADLAGAEKALAECEEAQKESARIGGEVASWRIIADRNHGLATEAKIEYEKAKSSKEQCETLEKEAATASEDLAKAKTESLICESEAFDMALLKEAFGANGLKVIVVEQVIPLIEDRVNAILADLSDFRVRIDTDRDGSKAGTKVDGLFVTIVNGEGQEMDYASYSGGEKGKIALAFSEALASFSRCAFRILDEPCSALDEAAVEKFTGALITLLEKDRQVICVSHVRKIKDLFEDRLLATKAHGITTIALTV